MHYLLNTTMNYITCNGPEKELTELLGDIHTRKAKLLKKLIDDVVVS